MTVLLLLLPTPTYRYRPAFSPFSLFCYVREPSQSWLEFNTKSPQATGLHFEAVTVTYEAASDSDLSVVVTAERCNALAKQTKTEMNCGGDARESTKVFGK